MKNRTLTAALSVALSTGVGSAAMAGGIERTVQSVAVIFEKGRYLELGLTFASPDVSGVGSDLTATPGVGSGNILESYQNYSFAFKDDINEKLSYALIFDQPFGADVAYPDTNYFGANTTAELNTNALTGVLQYNINGNASVFAGARVQSLSANANVPFLGNYKIDADRDVSVGYLVGAAYEVPEIAARVSLTYNSGIDHDFDTDESFGPLGMQTQTEIDTPQSVNLEFQSGINPKTLLFGSIRWVEWSAFEIAPPAFVAATGSPLAGYADDRITYNLGVGRALNENWSLLASLGYERQTGSPTGNLTPTDGFMRYTVGAIYRKDKIKVTAGISYVDIGDANSQLGPIFPAGIFTGNSAIGAGVRIGYSF
ncbi:MAG: outer membrane protein transport protein [Marinibacterium sp.]|nr:outer membrane protein transport protein [Marinibacterium sp.]